MLRRGYEHLFLVLLIAWPVGCSPDGPKKYPVSGTVTVNGKTAHLVRVQFLHTDGTVTGNARMPVAVTDEAGAFKLSTSGDKDGAVAGEYAVTFEWLSENDIGAFDKLGGAFADPKKTAYRATVPAKSDALPPFEISVPETAILTKPRRPGRP